MTARWTRTERPATADELATLKSHADDRAALWVAFVLWLPLAIGGYLLGRYAGPSLEVAAGIVLGLASGTLSPLAYRRWRAHSRRRERHDLEASLVEVLAIRDARAIVLPGRHSSTNPAFAFALEGGRTLLLMGEWLWQPETYGGLSSELDPEDERDDMGNGLPPPYSFPTSDFVVHRFPASGLVLRIEVRGDYVEPTLHPGRVNLEPFNDAQSYFLECEPAELVSALEAHRME